MDLVYTVSRRLSPKSQVNAEWSQEGRAICSISTRNVIAFTSATKLEDCTGKTWGSHAYVADLNVPWDSHLVMSNDDAITCLEWDVSGHKLLIADISGLIQIWTMKDYLINEWICSTAATFSGEHILCAVWFHHGKKIIMNSERKDAVLYSDKFTDRVRFAPSVRHFGGRPKEGCLAISMTGMVCVVIIHSDGTTTTSYESLAPVRSRLKVVHLCYGKNGDFLVTASDGTANSVVQCYKVALRLHQEKCTVNSQQFPSFYPNCYGSNTVTDKTVNRITHLKFVVREAADAIIVCASGLLESVVELWELREKPIMIHKMFPNPSMDAKFKTVGWQHQASVTASSQVVALTTPRTSIYDGSPPPSYILAAYKDSAIKCFLRDSLHQVCNIAINPNLHFMDDTGVKQLGGAATISDMQLTWTGNALIAIDCLSQIYLYRLSPIIDPAGPISPPNYAVSMLEYCLITGLDWWDILLCLRPGTIESICDKMSDNFNRQPASFQQFWFSRFLAIKMTLYRCLSVGQSKVGDCYALLMLNAVANCFKSVLRPTDLTSQDKGPSENLSAIMTSKQNIEMIDVDKVLLNLEKNKEFFVEPATLQSLQQLIQWVADLTLYLLASLPQQYQNTQYPGSGLLNDIKALSTLRELILIIRLWGFIRQTCLPVFTKTSDTLDVLALLFKLLTKKTLICHGRETVNRETDDSLIDECCLLPSQVMIPTLHLGITAQGVASPSLSMNSLPFPFEYGTEPSFMRFKLQPNLIEGAIVNNQKYDIVRHLSMGVDPPLYKQCTRCASVSIMKIPQKSSAMRAWDQKWTRACPCGGHWKLVKSNS